MDSKQIVSDSRINKALSDNRFNEHNAEEGRLMLLELLVKANSGSYNSHTEEAFVQSFGLLKKDRTLNKDGRNFVCSMLYKHSNNKSDFVELSNLYRR